MTQLEIDKKYTIVTKHPSVLGAKLTDMTFEGTTSIAIAKNFHDIASDFNQIQASATTLDTIKNLKIDDLNWLLFKNPTGVTIALASEYIDESMIEVTNDSLSLKITGATAKNKGSIEHVLQQLGFGVSWE